MNHRIITRQCSRPGCQAAYRLLPGPPYWAVQVTGDGVTWLDWDGAQHQDGEAAHGAAVAAMRQHMQHQHQEVTA